MACDALDGRNWRNAVDPHLIARPSGCESGPADGLIIVGDAVSAYDPVAFRWDPIGGAELLGTLPGDDSSVAASVSADGSVVVGESGQLYGHYQAVRWTRETGMVGLGFLPGAVRSTATAISADGQTIVGWSEADGIVQAFRWTADDGMVGLGYAPGAQNSMALGVSADGSVVFGQGWEPEEPFIWDAAHGMRLLRGVLEGYGLDLTGWQRLLPSADRGMRYAVSWDGRTIVGDGQGPQNPDGTVRDGWIARLWTADTWCPGDLDGDNAVGLPDLSILLAAFGTESRAGDYDCDNQTGLSDLSYLLSRFGTSCP